MATKLQRISELADDTAYIVTRNVNGWKSYLNTAARLYKYSFDDQLLIYAQRPDATACATMDLWNNTMRRWVKPRSTGISLIRKDSSGWPTLENVFDVSDTHPIRGAKTPYLWQLREDHHADVAAALERQYGPTEERDIGWALMEQAKRAVNEVYRDRLEDLRYDTENSLLEELDDLNLEVRYKNLLTASVQYTILTRCGLDPSDYMEDDDLSGITEFSTPAVLHHLGDATSEVSMNLLNEIGRAVRRYEREALKNKEKNIEKPLANSPVIGYTEVREEFNTVKRESEERSIHHVEADLHEGGRLPDPQPGFGRTGGDGAVSPGQVRDAERNIPEGASSRDVHVDAADRAAGAAPAGDRPAGAGASGQHREGSDEAPERERGSEGQRSDGVGAGGEQLHPSGRGNGAGRDRLQVNQEQQEAAGEQPAVSASPDLEGKEAPAAGLARFSLFPTVEEQIEAIAEVQAEEKRQAGVDASSIHSVSDAVVDRALTSGGNSKHSVERIVAFFQKNPSNEDAAAFLEKEYGVGGKGLTIARTKYSMWFDKRGVRICPGNNTYGIISVDLPWAAVAVRISQLLKDGMFASQEKIDTARENELDSLADRVANLRMEFSDAAREKDYLHTVSEAYQGSRSTESTLRIKELLREPESRRRVLSELRAFANFYVTDRTLLRSRPTMSLPEMIRQIADLDKPVTEFKAVEGFAPAVGSFITENEIDQFFMDGPHLSDSKIRIYSYFMQGHDAKECAAFLRNEYGDTGHVSEGWQTWSDGKGLKLTRMDENSGFDGYDTVHLNWNQAQKRIRDLIEKDRYLTDKERESLPEQDKKHLAQRVYHFFSHVPDCQHRPFADGVDAAEGARQILPLLEAPKVAAKLFDTMLSDFAAVSPDVEGYTGMMFAMRDMGAFVRGESPMFSPLPESALQAEREVRERNRKKGQTTQKAVVTDAPGEASGNLAAVAHALASKRKPEAEAQGDGQFSLFSFGQTAEVEPREQREITDMDLDHFLIEDLGDPERKQRLYALFTEGWSDAIIVRRLEQEYSRSRLGNLEGGFCTLADGTRGYAYFAKELRISPRPEGKMRHVSFEEMAAHIRQLIQQNRYLSPEELERYQKDHAAPEPEKKYSLGYGYFGNGLTVWNSMELEDGDYKTIAHISPDRTVKFYVDDLPEEIKREIQYAAATSDARISATQDAPVFSTPPQVPEREQESSRSPWWDEYNALKESRPDHLVLYQVGGFFELYGEDAKNAAAVLGLPLTTRPIGGVGRVERCGFPVHQLEQDVEKLRGQYDVVISAVDAKTGERQTRDMASLNNDAVPRNFEFEYRLLSRLKADCEYFLGAGGRAEKHLAEGGIAAQIAKMRELHGLLPEKPEWLTAEDIDRYEAEMTGAEPEKRAVEKNEAPAPAGDAAAAVQNHTYEVTVTSAEALILTRPMSQAGITPNRTIQENGDVTFSVAESEKDTVERLITKIRNDISKAAAAVSKPKKARRTRPEINYSAFAKLFPEIVSGEYRSMRLQAGPSFMPLHVEWIADDAVAVSHTYRQNGDTMYDPEMTFRVDREKGTLEALTFRQDGGLPIYQEVYPEPGKWIPKLRSDLNNFAAQWMKNITEQKYIKERAVAERDGEDVDIYFSPEGTPLAAYDILMREADAITARLLSDESYANARMNSDKQNSRDECRAAISRIVVPMAETNTQFYNVYFDAPEAAQRFRDYLFETTYQQDMAAEQAPVSAVTLYREALALLVGAVRGSSFYDYLRDRETDYDSARDELDTEIAAMMGEIKEENPGLYEAYHTLPKFREWLIEDILEQTHQDSITKPLDAVRRYADTPDAPAWIQEAPAQRELESHSGIAPEDDDAVQFFVTMTSDAFPDPEDAFAIWDKAEGSYYTDQYGSVKTFADEAAAQAYLAQLLQRGQDERPHEPPTEGQPQEQPEPEGSGEPVPVERDFTPNVEGYLNLKAQYPDKIIGVQVGEFMMFYGKDAAEAAYVLETKAPTLDIPGLGATAVTGVRQAWQATLKKLLEHGKSVVLARPDPQRGADAPYEIIKERDISEYIPLGKELTIDGRRMKVDSINYADGKVSLMDMELAEKSRYPVFREEPIAFVREYVEEAEWREFEQTAHVENLEDSGTATERNEEISVGTVPTIDGHRMKNDGTRRLLPDDITFSDSIEEMDGILNFYLDCRFPVDQVFGTHVETDANDDYLNIYANYDIATGEVRDELEITLCRGDGTNDQLTYKLDRNERAALLEKMRDYCKQRTGQRLEELAASFQMDHAEADELEEAQRLIQDFCEKEYGQADVDFSDLTDIGIAYTTVTDDEIPIQVSVNLVDFSVTQTLDGQLVEQRKYKTLRELIDCELSGLDFDGLIHLEGEPEELLANAPAAKEKPEPAPEQVEIDGGRITKLPAPKTPVTSKVVGRVNAGAFDVIIEEMHFGPEQHNFHITDENLGAGGQKTKYQNNVAAIRTLKQIEAEGRLATPEEQEILSRYVGWGSLAPAFDEHNKSWTKEFAELQTLLTPEEYAAARATTLNAHYTSPIVIKAIYDAVERMGFQPGNVLEPSCGIGNFFGLLPETLSAANLYGVELDGLTGRIAKQLYQKANIAIDGFENTDHPDDFFDLAVGNVPFGSYKVHDRRYDRQNLQIHDYFLMKTLDKLRPGGIMAVITSKGTMDKKNSKVREALAQKADLLGAIRLPNNAFKANAGTEVTSDILFFQKRATVPEKLPEWVESGLTTDGVPLNQYYLQHPEMVLGTMTLGKSLYGNDTETACLPIEGADLAVQLAGAVQNVAPPNRELLKFFVPGQDTDDVEVETIPADPDVRNFSYTMKGSKTYFRENSRMLRVELGKTPTQRVRGMIGIRDSARKLIDLQLKGAADSEIKAEQANLNHLYDAYTKKYGILNSAGNRLSFNQDSSYPLLCSLEVLDDEGNFKRKADMFTKRTIQDHEAVTSVDTAAEALAVSIGERACVDLGFMASLMGGGDKIPQIVEDLKDVIFKDPATGPFDIEAGGTDWYKGWQTADEYLSGDVRVKLAKARAAAGEYPEFAVNVEALEQVQPKDLTAAEISVRIGAPWIKPEYYRQFIFELLQTPEYLRDGKIDVFYNKITGEWNVRGKSEDKRDNARIYATYGTKRKSAYVIFENLLNQRDTRVYDIKYEAGKEVRVLNPKHTAIAQQKAETIDQAFRDWIFKDPERRSDLCATYNRIFNSKRPREYNGDHIAFAGMNPEIRLEPHQRSAVARMLYGGNSLLAHCVGAGKTYEMTAAAMESKRLGLCQKSLFVVPNHLTEQWGSDFLALYPGAKVLVATKKDFKPKNRKKFCARIATGDYDAIIIGHSQFEKIPLSPERQARVLEDQINEIMDAIAEAKAQKEENWSIKQMEGTRKNLEAKLKKLTDKKKDDTVTFEELGIDRLFVDEAHYYKNLFLHTKMRNVAGISQTEAQKSSDMFGKCRYLDELTGGKGVTFATGTPVSNSMVELYTMMRYLQFDMLEEAGLSHFDDWAAMFGEKVSAVELKPEGTGFRSKTRFARFYNLPELMNLWKEAADIQTAEMLNLPVPEAEYITVTTEPSAAQKEMVQSLAERAEAVRSGEVKPNEDNMLKITSDGRKLALDQRIMNPLLGDDPNSKVNACVKNVFEIWQESTPAKGAQLVFCDLSTPKGRSESKDPGKKSKVEKIIEEVMGQDLDTVEEDAEGIKLEMGVYDDIRTKLIAKGVPAEEIAFIHDAHTDAQKAGLFAKVRSGQVRVLLGSTQKMGAGTNVQTRLVASHDLDCPWRPADLEQRAGRIVRRGNENEKVRIFRYVTKGTFDAYNWGLVENKQKFIGQIMTGKSPARSIEDVDATALSYAEVKMLATGDPRIKEKMELDIQVAKLKMLKANHMAQRYEMEDMVIKHYPQKMAEAKMFIRALTEDMQIRDTHPVKDDAFSMTVRGQTYTERKAAGEAIFAACKSMTDPDKPLDLGQFRGFPMQLHLKGEKFIVTMKQNLTYTAELADEPLGNVIRISNALEKIAESLENQKRSLVTLEGNLENAKEEAARPFPQEEELATKSARLSELNAELDNDGKSEKEKEQGDGEEPAQDAPMPPIPGGGKPSVRAALKGYTPPASVAAGPEKSHYRGASL